MHAVSRIGACDFSGGGIASPVLSRMSATTCTIQIVHRSGCNLFRLRCAEKLSTLRQSSLDGSQCQVTDKKEFEYLMMKDLFASLFVCSVFIWLSESLANEAGQGGFIPRQGIADTLICKMLQVIPSHGRARVTTTWYG